MSDRALFQAMQRTCFPSVAAHVQSHKCSNLGASSPRSCSSCKSSSGQLLSATLAAYPFAQVPMMPPP
eukprot:CAMPEP_0175076416 /NCGR_PEP_ID=MMETSP0052_2-20121109/22711_1 /TAXON_ID=51329 ORGANISM="Polytomella parva, Strain SAG 63-3" /NCGR_SAMPLE_ID=MMETSP0052_2 /ASSEMBLY_ACC=CAM_ASM_000194 /LENGTH=67 /DNA_ID=CAMNT_0016345545 /DNA_START=38 /DNA_END=237 /DNA_ORIENTATION=+